MTDEDKAAIEAMTNDQRKDIADVLAKNRYDNICALICSLFTLAGGHVATDLDFINGQLSRINEVHAREVQSNDTEGRRLVVPAERHYVFEPFVVTRCERCDVDGFGRSLGILKFYGNYTTSQGVVSDGVIVHGRQFLSQLG